MADKYEEFSEDWYRQQKKNAQEGLKEAENYYDQLTGLSRKARRENIKGIDEEIKKLQQQVDGQGEVTKQAKELIDLYEKQKRAAQSMYEVVGRITQEVSVTYNEFKNFLTTSAAQYNYAQKIAKEYLTVSRNIGVTGGKAEIMTRNFKDALPTVEQLGGDMSDLTDMMETIAEESGRAKILSVDDVINIEKIAKGVNLTANETAKMAETFDLMGVWTGSMSESLENVYKESQAIGLNANKVVKTLSNNMKTIQSYSFANGVKGMTEMAKQAVRMRLDVSDVLQMADKFYQPEAAIEAAANLQMLGGDIAEAFGDPFETMYLARNKPEELAKRVGEMTENMMQFNEETGEYEMPAEVRMQLKATGEQLGINTEKMIEMARQTSKIKDIKMKFTSIGDDDTRENLASLAKYSEKKGEFVIQHKGEELGLDEISGGLADEIIKANANEGKSDSDLFKNIAINTQTMSEQLVSLKEASMATIAGTTDLYEITAENMKETLITPMKEGMDEAITKFKSGFDPKKLFETEEWDDAQQRFRTTLDETGEEIADWVDGLIGTTGGAGDSESADNQNDGSGNTGTATDLVSMPGSGGRVLTGEFGSFSLDDRDLIVAGDPNKLLGGNSSGVPSKIEFGNINISGRLEVVSPDGSTSNLDMSSIKPQIEKMIINQLNGSFRKGGVTSSKERTDYIG
jgi:hypothetical protein